MKSREGEEQRVGSVVMFLLITLISENFPTWILKHSVSRVLFLPGIIHNLMELERN